MNIENANEIVKNILLGNNISKEENNSLNAYINYLISKMNDEIISYEEQSILDIYINYLRNNLYNMDLVNRYDTVITNKNVLHNDEEHVAQHEGHAKILRLEQKNGINSNGIILTSVILEVSILLGLLIGILILALS